MKCTWPTRIKPSLPNANYIPLVRVGSRIGCDMLCIGSVMLRVGSAFFRCQHVGIGNASWGSSPAQAPNPSRFVLQWNIGSRLEKPTNEIGSIDFLFKYVACCSASLYTSLNFKRSNLPCQGAGCTNYMPPSLDPPLM